MLKKYQNGNAIERTSIEKKKGTKRNDSKGMLKRGQSIKGETPRSVMTLSTITFSITINKTRHSE
jgi:hypothetical protein